VRLVPVTTSAFQGGPGGIDVGSELKVTLVSVMVIVLPEPVFKVPRTVADAAPANDPTTRNAIRRLSFFTAFPSRTRKLVGDHIFSRIDGLGREKNRVLKRPLDAGFPSRVGFGLIRVRKQEVIALGKLLQFRQPSVDEDDDSEIGFLLLGKNDPTVFPEGEGNRRDRPEVPIP
jgi:hypothetical protein